MAGKLYVALSETETMTRITALEQRIHEEYVSLLPEAPTLVVVPRTGHEVGMVFARAWDITALGIFQATLVKRPDGGFDYGQMPTREQLEGKDVLVVDGVCKRGETLEEVTALAELAGAASVKSAVIMNKPHLSVAGYKPDFIGEEVDRYDGAFYVFPWEMDEYMPVPSTPVTLPMVADVASQAPIEGGAA